MEDFISLADSQQGMQLLRNYIYDVSELPPSIIDQKLREYKKPKDGLKLSLSIPNIAEFQFLNNKEVKKNNSINLRAEEKYDLLDLGGGQDSTRCSHVYNKTWQGANRELYKVTEDDESLECSEEASDLEAKLNEFSLKITSSIVDKFPKLSIASLSVSDASFHNAYELYKKSYLDYVEPLDVISYPSPEWSDGDCLAIEAMKNQGASTHELTLSDSASFKPSLENKSENCSCPECGIF